MSKFSCLFNFRRDNRCYFKKKKIINFYSKLQGDFQLEMNKKYVDKLNLFSINLDEKVILSKKKSIIILSNLQSL